MNSLNLSIKLRGHHFICLHFFSGEGYNSEFVANLREILKRVEAGEEIEVYPGADDICKKCPYLQKDRCLYGRNAESEIREMDRTAIKFLRLKNQERVKWGDIRKKIPEILNEWSGEYCKECDWRWICEREPRYNRAKEGLVE